LINCSFSFGPIVGDLVGESSGELESGAEVVGDGLTSLGGSVSVGCSLLASKLPTMSSWIFARSDGS